MIELLLGDCLDRLRELPDCSVDACVTDPPYGLSFMGKAWDYDVPQVDVWREVLRVLKPGGHLLAFAGTRTQHRMAVQIEDAGFEIRDLIAWVYGSGFPKSRNLAGDWQGWGTALKPALEPITVARKPLGGRTVAANVLEHGTGAINVDGCRVGTEQLPAMTAGQPRIGTFERGVMVTPERVGRWPANLIHDGSDEVVELFPESNSSKPSANGRYGENKGKGADGVSVFTIGFNSSTPNRAPIGDSGSAARFFYCAKASKADRGEGNGHPTVKPTELMRYLCRLVTPPGGVVLDPFMGSGSTGKAAALEDFRFIGIEREAEYLEIARSRIEVPAQGSLL